MICTCVDCLYTFKTITIPERCPDCGHEHVREATMEEKDSYYDLEMERKYNPDLLDKRA